LNSRPLVPQTSSRVWQGVSSSGEKWPMCRASCSPDPHFSAFLHASVYRRLGADWALARRATRRAHRVGVASSGAGFGKRPRTTFGSSPGPSLSKTNAESSRHTGCVPATLRSRFPSHAATCSGSNSVTRTSWMTFEQCSRRQTVQRCPWIQTRCSLRLRYRSTRRRGWSWTSF
jgi:hypothetical protein